MIIIKADDSNKIISMGYSWVVDIMYNVKMRNNSENRMSEREIVQFPENSLYVFIVIVKNDDFLLTFKKLILM